MTTICEQSRNFGNEPFKRKATAVASQSTTFVVGQRVFRKERRIAENGIKSCFWLERENILHFKANSLFKRTFCHILPSLMDCILVNIYTQHLGFRIPLCSHQSYQSCARTNIQNTITIHITPSTQQNAVRANLHSTAVVVDDELFETKEFVTHFEGHFFFGVQIYNN